MVEMLWELWELVKVRKEKNIEDRELIDKKFEIGRNIIEEFELECKEFWVHNEKEGDNLIFHYEFTLEDGRKIKAKIIIEGESLEFKFDVDHIFRNVYI